MAERTRADWRSRFWKLIELPSLNECWPWLGPKDRDGYGKFRITHAGDGRRHLRAHRVAYELMVGPIPEGLVIDHLCRNRGCVNPLHLEVVTVKENTRRGLAGHHRKKWAARLLDGSERCKNGHVLTMSSTRPDSRNRERRICKQCCTDRFNEWKARQASPSIPSRSDRQPCAADGER